MKKILSATKSVLEIKDLHFEGNVVPHNWYTHIKNKSGASDLLAITLLSEIVYWYRLMPVYDKEKDVLLGYKKKFNADKLQKQTKELANKFGFSEQSTNSALKRLVDLKLITREFRDITLKNGAVIQKRQFLDIVPTNILLISTIKERCTRKLSSLDKNLVEGVQESYSYTCITSENSNKEENTNTVALSFKISENPNTKNSNNLKDNAIPPPTPVAAEPLPPVACKEINKEKESNSVKQPETVLESTNASKTNTLYTNNIKLIVERFNELSNKSLNYETKEYQKLITKCLKEFSKKELQNGSAAEKVGKMLEMKLKHTEKDSPIFFQKQYFRISTLFAKANFDKYMLELEEMTEESSIKEEKKQELKKKNNGVLPNSFL